MFDFFFREVKGAIRQTVYPRLRQYPAYLGYTVYQSEYDALNAECDRAHALNDELNTKLDSLCQQLDDTELLRANATAAYDEQVAKKADLQERLQIRDDRIAALHEEYATLQEKHIEAMNGTAAEMEAATALIDVQKETIRKQRDAYEQLQSKLFEALEKHKALYNQVHVLQQELEASKVQITTGAHPNTPGKRKKTHEVPR